MARYFACVCVRAQPSICPFGPSVSVLSVVSGYTQCGPKTWTVTIHPASITSHMYSINRRQCARLPLAKAMLVFFLVASRQHWRRTFLLFLTKNGVRAHAIPTSNTAAACDIPYSWLYKICVLRGRLWSK